MVTEQKKFKIILIGDYAVGKTSIMEQFLYARFEQNYSVTIGVEYGCKQLDNQISFEIWDTAGQERYRNITRNYFKLADIVFYVYDLTCRSSFENISLWKKDYFTYSTHPPVYQMLLANKSDLADGRTVSTLEGLELTQLEEFDHFSEVSAQNHLSIDSVFAYLYGQVLELEPYLDQTSISLYPSHPNFSGKVSRCC